MLLLKLLIVLLPWFVRRRVLNRFFGYKVHRDSHIGFAWIFPKQLTKTNAVRLKEEVPTASDGQMVS